MNFAERILRLVGPRKGGSSAVDGMYVVEYDPTRPGTTPDGKPAAAHIVLTDNPEKAKRFPDGTAAVMCWSQESGKPYPQDKPLTYWLAEARHPSSASIVTVQSLRRIGMDTEADLVQWMLDHRAESGCDDTQSEAWVAQAALGHRRYWELRDLITGEPGGPYVVHVALRGTHNLASGGVFWNLYGSGGEQLDVSFRTSIPRGSGVFQLSRWVGGEEVKVRVRWDPKNVRKPLG